MRFLLLKVDFFLLSSFNMLLVPWEGRGFGKIWGPRCLFMSPLLQCVTGDLPGNGDEHQPV